MRTPLGLILATSLFCSVTVARSAQAQTSGVVMLTPGFAPDPQRLAGASGGTIQASTLNSNCRGWISPQANHAIVVQGGLPFLRVYVESSGDTTLVIRAPNGQFVCNDDTFGFNPDVDAAYGAGQYLVWVGSYQQGNSSPYTITFSEQRTTMPASAANNGADQNTGPDPNAPTTTTGSAGSHTLSYSTSGGGAIFDFHTTSASVSVAQDCNLTGLDVAVRGRHTFFSDLVVRLRDPTGETETLQSHNSRNPFRHYSTTHFNGESAQGTWTLTVEDTVGQDGGNLNGFTLSPHCQ